MKLPPGDRGLAWGSPTERSDEKKVLGSWFFVLRWCREVLVLGSSCSGRMACTDR